MNAPGYEIRDLIHESANSLIYHGLRIQDDKPVVIKMFRDAYPTPERIAWFKREFLITRGLHLEGVAESYALELIRDRWSIIFEECDAQSLDQLGLAGNLSLRDLLELAIKITSALGQIHRRYIIHKDVNPTNIILNVRTRELKLIDFGSSTVLSREDAAFQNPNILEGTLAYISPEQTGRMNRAVDYRTDFYSLGVTLYHLATGKLPFQTPGAMEMVHCHIAREPEPPHELNPNIPPIVSDLILKLMAKNAEDRYQTVYGLKADLERCLSQAREKARIDVFTLGESDISDRFRISQKLYGRDTEIADLLEAFDRVRQGGSEITLVAGDAGIGKSALARETYQQVTLSRGFFVSGKFDQFQRDIPYDSLIQAFSSLVEQLLTESERTLDAWRGKLLEAMGALGQVVVDVIPEVALITGPQPPVETLPPVEAQNRFNLVFQKFISVFADERHPLVLFLDDLQWVDGASLKLIQSLMETGCSYLLLIGAYRDKEVEETHPLVLTMDSIRKSGARVNRIDLAPLGEDHLVQLVADALYQDVESVRPLAGLILEKTGGNPFFFNEFLKSLYNEDLISFDDAHGRWSWDLDRIRARQIADNVAALMSDRLLHLPADTLECLRVAACVGNRFELRFLAALRNATMQEAAQDLWPAMTRGLILPLDANYKLVEASDEALNERLEVNYKFAHDRIQHAVYMLIPEGERAPIHRKIGRLLLEQLSSEALDRRIFDVVNQLNASGKPASPAERVEMALLNRDAGIKALKSAAYQPAFNYLNSGLTLLASEDKSGAGDAWQEHYDLCLDLHTRTAEAAYLNDDYETMNRLVERVLQRAKILLDKAPAYEVKINALVIKNEPRTAVLTALKILKLLKVPLPEDPDQAAIATAIDEALNALGARQPEDLLDLPAIADPEKIAVMRILESIFLPALTSIPNLAPIIASKQVVASIEYGNAEESPIGYVNFGLMLSGANQKHELAYRLGKLARRLLERTGAKKYRARTTAMEVCNLAPWKEPISESLPALLEAYPSGLETGDFPWAANCLASYAAMGYLAGLNLEDMSNRFRNADKTMARLGQELYRGWVKIWWQSALNWMGRSPDPLRLIGEVYDETAMEPYHREGNDQTALFIVQLNKAMLAYHFDQRQDIARFLPALTSHNQQGGPLGPLSHFYASLIRLAGFQDAAPPERSAILAEVAANQEKMGRWAELAPMNYRHKHCLVEAELARARGAFSEARDHYDQAIEHAGHSGCLGEEALATELAARFFLERDQYRLARHYMEDARYAYQRWGALAKVHDLETRYPQTLHDNRRPAQAEPTSVKATTVQKGSSEFDLAGVLQASQAIARELIPSRMFSQVMEVLLEIAGAQKGYLLKKTDGRWFVEVEGSLDGATGALEPAPPVDGFEDLPGAVVNYALKTHKDVVLDDATKAPIFGKDPYIVKNKPKSALCSPILHQGEVAAVLYLENNLNTGVFTEDRLEVLQLLSSQTAISIENAALYASLERKVTERTAALNERNEQILASIRYAKQIQAATLPDQELDRILQNQHFVIFLPRDLVSGDFYWIYQAKNAIFLAVIDCTGHGVPGALMSMVGSTLLDKLIRGQGLTDPAQILEQLHLGIREILWREVEHQTNAGMDICLCRIDEKPLRVVFAGAMRPLYHVGEEDGVLAMNVVKSNRRSVDGRQTKGKPFENHLLGVKRGDMIYLTTDGYPDQQNRKRLKIGTPLFKKILLRNADRPLEEQKEILLAELEAHRGLEQQRDDITIIGLRL